MAGGQESTFGILNEQFIRVDPGHGLQKRKKTLQHVCRIIVLIGNWRNIFFLISGMGRRLCCINKEDRGGECLSISRAAVVRTGKLGKLAELGHWRS